LTFEAPEFFELLKVVVFPHHKKRRRTDQVACDFCPFSKQVGVVRLFFPIHKWEELQELYKPLIEMLNSGC